MTDVCVHGLGYVGLPTAAMLATSGWTVVGYDTNPTVRATLADGNTHIDEPGVDALLAESVAEGTLALADEVVAADYHVVCVPTPLKADKAEADLSYIEHAATAIHPHLRPGDTVVVESTVPPGTSADVIRPLLERSGLQAGEALEIAYSPETALPGNTLKELRMNDRIVGAVDGRSVESALRLYESFVEGQVRAAPDATTAEFVKLVQNTFRDTNIALANEVSKLAADHGVDTGQAIELVNLHPRVNLHEPGLSVGGHCLPIDPWFLGHDSDALDLVARARHINETMPDYVRSLLKEELAPTPSPNVGVLGVAYKANVGDTRESPGLALAQSLRDDPPKPVKSEPLANGGTRPLHDVTVTFHDPHVDNRSLNLSPLDEVLDGADAVVVTTAHDEYTALDPNRVADQMAGDLVLDTKRVLDTDDWATSLLRLRQL